MAEQIAPTNARLLMGGDYPDPSVLAHGGRLYMVHSSFDHYPGLLVWASDDGVAWQRVGHALHTYVGSVWAPELIEHGGRFFIYFFANGTGNQVVHADRIEGPWEGPVALPGVPGIDPGHVVAEDGTRWLHSSNGMATPMTADGLATAGEPRQVVEPWPIPDDWRIETLAFEGPKFLRHDGRVVLLAAEGGTAGPPTSHMVIAATGPDATGPFTWDPRGPMLHTASADDRFHSVGHGTIVRAPDDTWRMFSHGYEAGLATLGRQTLVSAVRWRDDGFPEVVPSEEVAGEGRAAARPHADPLVTDTPKPLGPQWQRFIPPKTEPAEAERLIAEMVTTPTGLTLAPSGPGLADDRPVTVIATDPAYRVEVTVTRRAPGVEAGLGLFYLPHAFTALTLTDDGPRLHHHNGIPARPANLPTAGPVTLRLDVDRDVVDRFVIADGQTWYLGSGHISGLNHHTFGGFLALRPALFTAGPSNATATFTDFRYEPRDPKSTHQHTTPDARRLS